MENKKEEFDLDDRMTEENRVFVVNSLRAAKPNDTITQDLNKVREARYQSAVKENSYFKFDDLEIEELKVASKYDEYEIPVFSFKPKEIRENSPITIFFHGGGWILGSTQNYLASLSSMAVRTKSVWLSVDYRLSPENKYPIPVNDCFSVFEWVAANKDKFSSSPNAKLGVCGDSAGGHFSALISNEYSSLLDYQILIYPYVDFSKLYPSELEFTKDCYFLTLDLMDYFRTSFLDDKSLASSSKVSPILKEDLSNVPNTLIVAAELDPLVDHSREYFNKLQNQHVKSQLVIIKGVNHGFFKFAYSMKNAFNELQQSVSKFMESI